MVLGRMGKMPMPRAKQMTSDLRQRVIAEMKALFGDDQSRIDHALRVLDFAEQILAESSADVAIVTAAAILHDIGIPAAEATRGSSAARYQEIEGPPIAREILEKINVAPATVESVCTIIAHHHNGQIDTPEFNIIWDADWLVNFPGHYSQADTNQRFAAIRKLFRTSVGRVLAEELFLRDD